MAFHDTKKNNGYHSLYIKLFGHVEGGAFFPDTVYNICALVYNAQVHFWHLVTKHFQTAPNVTDARNKISSK